MEEQLEAMKLKVLDRINTSLSTCTGEVTKHLAQAYLLLEQAHTEIKRRHLMRIQEHTTIAAATVLRTKEDMVCELGLETR